MDITLMNLNLVKHDAIGNHIVNLAKVLSKSHNVTLLIQDPVSVDATIKNSYRFQVDKPEGYVAYSPMQKLLKKININYVPFSRRYVKKYTGDVLWANYPRFYSYMNILRYRNKSTVGIFDYHGVTPPEQWDDPVVRPILVEGVKKASYARYADISIAHSDFSVNELSHKYDVKNVQKMPYVIDTERFTPNRDGEIRKKYGLKDEKILLYVGRMAGNKRVDVIIKALSIIRKSLPDIKFLCVGNIDFPHSIEYEKLRRIVARERLEDNVIFTGSVREEDIPGYFNAADIYVTSSTHEGFCIPVLEAMACGKPVIGSACTALPETIGDGGVVFKPCDEASLAAEVIQMINDNNLYNRYSANGIVHARKYSLANFERSVDSIITLCK